MSALLEWLSPALGWLVPVAVGVGGVVLAWLGGSRSARGKAERDALARRVQAWEVRGEVDRDVARGGDGAAADELQRDWRRGL